MTPMRYLLSCALLCATALAGCRSTVDAVMGTEPRGPLAELDWLTGSWVRVSGDGTSEEHWTPPSGGTMLGVNRTVIRGRTVAFEYLRIEKTDAGIIYLASPGGRYPPTAFELVESGPGRAVFGNPDHDFPQRIIYQRRGDRLEGRIEGEQDGRTEARDWFWKRTAMDAMPR